MYSADYAKELEQKNHALREQRDDLLAALKAVVNDRGILNLCTYNAQTEEMVHAGRAAITKVEFSER